AKQLDPDSAEVQAHIAALAYYVDWDWASADREFRRFSDLGSTFPDGYMWYADFLVNVGHRFDEGIAAARRALALDPMNAFYQVPVGVTLGPSRRDDEAIAVFKRVLEGDPRMRPALVNLTYTYAGKKMYVEAFNTMQSNAVNPAIAEAQRRAYAEGGFLRAARLRPDIMAEQARRTYVSPFGIAGAYSRAGEKELTLPWLEKAFEEHETTLVNLGAAREFDFMRGDPRFEALRARMKFPN